MRIDKKKIHDKRAVEMAVNKVMETSIRVCSALFDTGFETWGLEN